MPIQMYKNLGETPLEALERLRIEKGISKDTPMTYAGRLDPMAEGELLILVGEECKDKEKYLGLDKEYEVEIVFGISTDTYDALGVPIKSTNSSGKEIEIDLNKYVGRFKQEYPAYSSKTVNGKQLHELARAGELPKEMPRKEVEIYSIEQVNKGTITAADLKRRIGESIKKVKGDFRQEEIIERWEEVLSDVSEQFEMLTIKVKCSSGTYMRSLAEQMGKERGSMAFALRIKRTRIEDPQ